MRGRINRTEGVRYVDLSANLDFIIDREDSSRKFHAYRVEEKYASAPKSKIFQKDFLIFSKKKFVIRTGKGLQLIYI